jgi:hypothetical protein
MVPSGGEFAYFEYLSRNSYNTQSHIPLGLTIQDFPRFMHLADCAFISSSDMLEKDGLDVLRTWLASLETDLWTVGTPSPPDVPEAGGVVSTSSEDQKILAFLDRIHKSYGAKTLVYVSTCP